MSRSFPGTEGVAEPDDALAAAEELGFPVLLKAAAGGGGKGMRRRDRTRATSATPTTAPSAEAQAAFGDGSLYVEKVITPARHVEIQVLCDHHGHVLTCGERECSVQRRHQKLIEESPSPALDDELREAMEAAAERACRHIGYRNAGTFEFLVGPDGSFSFIELNARLQVEHPVTESIIGIDLVREQVRIAAGDAPRPRRPRRPAQRARDRAADQRRGSGARVRPGARADRALPAAARAGCPRRHVRRGRDGHLAALRLADREGRRPRRQAAASRSRGRCARLDELEIEGVPTTRDVLRDILDSDEFRSGEYSTSFLEEAGARLPALAQSALARLSRVLVQESGGSVRVSEAALSEIVRRAVASVDGARLRKGRRRLGVELEDGRARAELQLVVAYGRVLPEVCAAVQERVADALARMCDVEVEAVDVTVEELVRVVSTISRREARRAAVFMLFQWDVTGRPLGSLYEGDVDDYTRQLADAVTEHAAVLDARITSASDDWTADRLGAVERNVLRVALEELDEGEVPVEVVLDEAVTLAKRYASEDAARLVNGILGKLVREEQAK